MNIIFVLLFFLASKKKNKSTTVKEIYEATLDLNLGKYNPNLDSIPIKVDKAI